MASDQSNKSQQGTFLGNIILNLYRVVVKEKVGFVSVLILSRLPVDFQYDT